MKEFVQRQASAKLLGLVLVLVVGVMGLLEWTRDADRRELQVQSIAALEGGLDVRERQHLQIVTAVPLGPHVLDTSGRRHGGRSVAVLVAVGSPAAAKAMAEGRRVPLRVWVELPQRFASPEAAQAHVMKPGLLPPGPHQGLWEAMGTELSQAASPEGEAQGAGVLRLGATPHPVGDAAGLLAAAFTGLLMGLVWAAAEWRAWRWTLAQQRDGVQAFAGVSRRVFLGALSGPVAALGMFFFTRTAVDQGQLNAVALAFALLGLAATAFVLLSKDTLTLVGPDAIERLHGRRHETRDLSQVRQLFITPAGRDRLPDGLVLHCKHSTPLALGNGWRAGAVARGTALTQAVRQHVFARLAPAYARGLAQHKPFDFQGVRLTHEGLARGDEALPWDEIERVDLEPHQLSIQRRQQRAVWAKLALGKTPNVDVLLHLLRQNQVDIQADRPELLAYWTLNDGR